MMRVRFGTARCGFCTLMDSRWRSRMRAQSTSIANAFVPGRWRARPKFASRAMFPDHVLLLLVRCGLFAPLPSFLAHGPAVGKGGEANFLRERSLFFCYLWS